VTGHLPSTGSWPPSGNTGLAAALTGASLVVIPAGVPRKPGMTRDDLFNTNAGIVKSLVEHCAEHCPNAVLAIISNPVNSTVPIAAEVLKKHGVYDPKKLCGVTTLDVMRANTFVANHMQVDPSTIHVPVIGGHAGITILPLFSQVPQFTPSDTARNALTVRTQFGGDEVVQAKAGTGSATLSMAYAGYVFAENVVRALQGEPHIQQCAYVESNVVDQVPYFASPCVFGRDGIEHVQGYGTISAYEQAWLDQLIPDLQSQIQKGIAFAQK
jgi:malate dehydrogenase